MIFGSGHPYCVALLFLSPEPTLRWAAQAGLAETQAGPEGTAVLSHQLLAAPELQARLREAIVRANADADRWEHVQRFTLLAGPLSVESGMLTPTLKVRRVALAERHAAELDALYQAEPAGEPPSPVVVAAT